MTSSGAGSGAETGDAARDAEAMLMEYRALSQFLHLSPVGVLRARLDGQIVMMNPMAANLLTPCLVDLDAFNLFLLPDGIGPRLQAAIAAYDAPMGVVCQDMRLVLPEPVANSLAPRALGLAVLRLSVDPQHVVVLVTDQSAAHQLDQTVAGGAAD